jgi:hypothetical protein
MELKFIDPRSLKENKVQAPALVGPIWHQHWSPRAQSPFATAALANLKLLLAIEPPELLDVHRDPLALQHHVDTPIAKPASLRRHGLHRFPQILVGSPRAAIPHTRSINLKCFTRPPLAHPMHKAGLGHRISLRVGRHH